MSLVETLASGFNFAGLTVDKPAPVRGDEGFTVFRVERSLERGARSRKLTLKAELAGIGKKRMPQCELLKRLPCNNEVFVDTSELPINLDELDRAAAIETFTDKDLVEFRQLVACD